MAKTFLFIADAIDSFDKKSETSFYLMAEICRQGHVCLHGTLADICGTDSGVAIQATAYHVNRNQSQLFEYSPKAAAKSIPIKNCDVVFLRKDPPVDMAYHDHLSLLMQAEAMHPSVVWVNSPSGIKLAHEKILTLSYADLIPPTCVSMSVATLKEFASKHDEIVVKPTNLSGGRGIIRVKATDRDIAAKLSESTNQQTSFVVAQRFLPEALQGDKRIVLLDGDVLGSFVRIPKEGEFRANLHSGGSFHPTTLTAHDMEIVSRVAPFLKASGLPFVGLDVIGNCLTEINVTSPMGIGEINTLTLSQIETSVINWTLR